jgi:hypothetical protein
MVMQEVLPGNGLVSTLNGAITAAATTLAIQAADAAKWPSSGLYRAVLFQDATNGPWELVRVTGGQGTATLTVTRAVEPYNGVQTALAWPSGTSISAIITHDGLALVAGPQVAILVYEATGVTGSTVTLPQTPLSGGILTVAVNGQIQQTPSDYTVSGATVTFVVPLSADSIHIEYQVSPYNPSVVASHYETTLGVGQNTITLPVAPIGYPLITRDGVAQYQSAGHYSLSGAVITFAEPIATGEGGRISVDYTAGGIAAPPNASTVNFFPAVAAVSAAPNSLVATDANGKLPASVLPAQNTVYHEEFLPAAGITTVTLSQTPAVVLDVFRDGVAQSVSDGHYSVSGAVITFTDALDGSSRVLVTYVIGLAVGAASTVGGFAAYAGSSVPVPNALVATGSDSKYNNRLIDAYRNLLTNGGFELWQRGTGPYTAHLAYGPDRWRIALTGTDTLSVSRSTTADTVFGSQYSAACTFVLGTGAGNTNLQQYFTTVDNAQTYNRAMMFSVRVQTSTPNAVRLGYYNGSAWVYGTQYHTGDGTWQTLVLTIPALAITTQYVAVVFAASCTAYVDSAMLIVGTTYADFYPWPPAVDLTICQRYYEEVGPANSGTLILRTANPTAATYYADTVLRWAVRKPASPTLTKNGTWSANNCTQPSTANLSVDGARMEGSTGPAAGDSYVYNAGTGCNLVVEANP